MIQSFRNLLVAVVVLAGAATAAVPPYGPVVPPFDKLVAQVHAENGQKHQYASAIATANRALQMNPPSSVAAIFFTERCYAKQRLGDDRQAIADCSEAIRLVPGMKAALSYRASSYSAVGQDSQAVDDLTLALKLNYAYKADLYSRRAAAYSHLGRSAEAQRDLEEVTRAPMQDAADYCIRARANARLGLYSAATADFAVAKRTNISDSVTLNSAAWFEATCPEATFRNGSVAVADATKACELTEWRDAGVIDTLAVAYAENANFSQALRYEERAIKTANPSYADAKILQNRIELFRQQKPFHEEPRP